MNDDELAGILVHGLRRTRVELADPDPAWATRYVGRAAQLRRMLGERVRLLEHVGSTSVPGLAAKPVVDIVLGVDDPDDEPAYLLDLVEAGYELRVREPRHRCLRAGEPGEPVNLHCYAADDPEVRRVLLFRDRLRAVPADRRRYEALKRELAMREWPDMNYYAEAKGPLIEEILRAAGWSAG